MKEKTIATTSKVNETHQRNDIVFTSKPTSIISLGERVEIEDEFKSKRNATVNTSSPVAMINGSENIESKEDSKEEEMEVRQTYWMEDK